MVVVLVAVAVQVVDLQTGEVERRVTFTAETAPTHMRKTMADLTEEVGAPPSPTSSDGSLAGALELTRGFPAVMVVFMGAFRQGRAGARKAWCWISRWVGMAPQGAVCSFCGFKYMRSGWSERVFIYSIGLSGRIVLGLSGRSVLCDPDLPTLDMIYNYFRLCVTVRHSLA